MEINRPFLVLPELVAQPTWGGTYIARFKGWEERPELKDVKIGQSYELSGNSRLALDAYDSEDPKFTESALHPEDHRTFAIKDADAQTAATLFGAAVMAKHGRMPLLIKFTQALGNSFQLHVKQDQADGSWKPKPETWYFLENGKATLGIRPGARVEEYKQACTAVDAFMHKLSAEVMAGRMPLETAKKKARESITRENPWQYVNIVNVPKGAVVDLSSGGIHHSWEEDPMAAREGNIVYEVQVDVSDAESTLRSFDQGKFKADGSVRTLTVDDYFRYLDADPGRNEAITDVRTSNGPSLATTPLYTMEKLDFSHEESMTTDGKFAHLFVLSGGIEVTAGAGAAKAGKGTSVLVPAVTQEYRIKPLGGHASIILTYVS